jgi:dihydroorotase
MAQTYDVILKGGTVVNQDGRVAREVGDNGGK